MKVWVVKWDSSDMMVYATREDFFKDLQRDFDSGYILDWSDLDIDNTSVYADDYVYGFETEVVSREDSN